MGDEASRDRQGQEATLGSWLPEFLEVGEIAVAHQPTSLQKALNLGLAIVWDSQSMSEFVGDPTNIDAVELR
ncbi:MAG: hypothetical protein ACI9UA_003857, partial [Pseudoalteromonas tetraodonis]